MPSTRPTRPWSGCSGCRTTRHTSRWGTTSPRRPASRPCARTSRRRDASPNAYRRRRALVVADGYYEWRKVGAREKQPYFIRPRSGSPFAFGALWETWRDPATGEPLQSCSLITTAAAREVAHIHERMPVIIPPDAYAEWLDPNNDDCERLDRLLAPDAAGELVAHPVSRMVSNARSQGAQLIEPVHDVTSGLPLEAPPPCPQGSDQ